MSTATIMASDDLDFPTRTGRGGDRGLLELLKASLGNVYDPTEE